MSISSEKKRRKKCSNLRCYFCLIQLTSEKIDVPFQQKCLVSASLLVEKHDLCLCSSLKADHIHFMHDLCIIKKRMFSHGRNMTKNKVFVTEQNSNVQYNVAMIGSMLLRVIDFVSFGWHSIFWHLCQIMFESVRKNDVQICMKRV